MYAESKIDAPPAIHRKDLPRDELIFELRRIIAAVFEPAVSPDLPRP